MSAKDAVKGSVFRRLGEGEGRRPEDRNLTFSLPQSIFFSASGTLTLSLRVSLSSGFASWQLGASKYQ